MPAATTVPSLAGMPCLGATGNKNPRIRSDECRKKEGIQRIESATSHAKSMPGGLFPLGGDRSLYIFFADDSRQDRPTRPGMVQRPLIAIGGFAVDGDRLRDLEAALDACCQQTGFQKLCEFKWSPPPDNWMNKNLTGDDRRDFFVRVLQRGEEFGITAFVVVEDEISRPAQQKLSHQRDALELFLERISTFLSRNHRTGIVIADQPGGGRTDENSFLLSCLEAREQGTSYVQHRDLALGVLCAKSKFVRCLQLADLIVSATLARVAGNRYAVPIFDKIRPLLGRYDGRIGGCGLKIHPDGRYRNLYYWLLQDTVFVKGSSWRRLPDPSTLYSHSEYE